MSITAHTIKPAKGSTKKVRRLGRGNASGRGNYSGHGGKGQTARSGGGSRSRMRVFKQQLLKVPKLRGFKSLVPKKETVTLSSINRIAKEGETITPKILKLRGVIGRPQNGVKIVASGELNKKITLLGCLASKKAVEMIEKNGSKIVF